jgi:hypothetical protein
MICTTYKKHTYCLHKIIVLVTLVIIIYGLLPHEMRRKAPLSKKVFKCIGCDYYGILTALLFMVLGFLFPTHIFELLLLGIILFKVGQMIIRRYPDTFFKGEKRDIPNEDYEMWFGTLTDIGFIVIGLVVGWKLRQIV